MQGGKAAGVDIFRACRRAGTVCVRLQFVGGRNHQVLAILIVARIVGQLEQAAHRQAAGVGLSLYLLVLGLEFLDTGADIGFAIPGLHVFARIVENFHLGLGMIARDGRFHLQIGFGVFEIEVVEGIHPGLHLL